MRARRGRRLRDIDAQDARDLGPIGQAKSAGIVYLINDLTSNDLRSIDPSMPRPATAPIGLQLTRTAKLVSRAFDDALAEAGGSLPMWQLLISLKAQPHGMQRDLAHAVGIEGPTVTHHLNRMERAGLLKRTRDPDNRRVHRIELSAEGEAMFQRLRQAVVAFDRRLRAGLTSDDLAALSGSLERLRRNVAARTDKESVR